MNEGLIPIEAVSTLSRVLSDDFFIIGRQDEGFISETQYREISEILGVTRFQVALAYLQPQRVYHGVKHIEHMYNEMFKMLSTSKTSLGSSFVPQRKIPLLLAAIVYHDYIYEIGAKDNEVRSAEAFRRSPLSRLFPSLIDQNEIYEAILATSNHAYRFSSNIETALLDLDLIGMAYSTSYWANRSKILEETGLDPNSQDWIQGRSSFLKDYKERVIPFAFNSFGSDLSVNLRRDTYKNMNEELEHLARLGG